MIMKSKWTLFTCELRKVRKTPSSWWMGKIMCMNTTGNPKRSFTGNANEVILAVKAVYVHRQIILVQMYLGYFTALSRTCVPTREAVCSSVASCNTYYKMFLPNTNTISRNVRRWRNLVTDAPAIPTARTGITIPE